MTPKQKRKSLFKQYRPTIRELQLYEGDKYHKDVGRLWVAYHKKPFGDFTQGLDQQGFANELAEVANMATLYVIDDKNLVYQQSGPVALLAIHSDGWRIEPHVEFLPWATPRNRLKCAVAVFQWARYQKIGVCLVRALEDAKPLFDRCTQYDVLKYTGKINNGDPRGDEYLYHIRGTKDVRRT